MSSFHAAFSLGGLLGAAAAGILFVRSLGPATYLPLAGAIVAGLVLLSGPGLRAGARDAPATGTDHGFVWLGHAMLKLGLLAFPCAIRQGCGDRLVRPVPGGRSGRVGHRHRIGLRGLLLAMTLGHLFGDATVRRFGAARTLRLRRLLTLAGLLPALALLGLGLPNAVPMLFTIAAGQGNDTSGPRVAAVGTVGYVGLLAGPPMIGFASNAAKLRAAMMMLAPAPAVLVLGAGRLRRG